MPHEEDVDAWAKEDCGCGHVRHAHAGGTGACRRTVLRSDYSSLPTAVYAEGEEDHPFAWPTNWPPAADVPVVEKPCDCTDFHDPEPVEPDEEQRS
jgi:hypothetical protein